MASLLKMTGLCLAGLLLPALASAQQSEAFFEMPGAHHKVSENANETLTIPDPR